jgi:hypothetical protein
LPPRLAGVLARRRRGQHLHLGRAPLAIAGEDRGARLDGVVRAYARLVSATFERHPGNVPPPAIRAYLETGG